MPRQKHTLDHLDWTLASERSKREQMSKPNEKVGSESVHQMKAKKVNGLEDAKWTEGGDNQSCQGDDTAAWLSDAFRFHMKVHGSSRK